ncbi:conserved hypothetical protein [Ricinus communis]|uniref:Uncharacterized protein n=1 Tax=Ricinus communis TaxID=3988 RepID=B9RD81_RICCO|nr:conserved hypothetical protein [Ricinus communis]
MKPESKKNRSATNTEKSKTGSSASCFDLTSLSQALNEEGISNESAYNLSELSKALAASVVEDKEKRVTDAIFRFKGIIDITKLRVERQMERVKKVKLIRQKLSVSKMPADRKKSAFKLLDERERMNFKFNRWRQLQMHQLLSAEGIKFRDELSKFTSERGF